jgi:hypothetical protein
MLGSLICPSGIFLSSPRCKNISVAAHPKSSLKLFASCPTEGRIRIVRDAGRGAVDAAASGVTRDGRVGSQESVSDQTAR